MLEWHFLIEGPPDTPYAGGWYIGKLRFPPEYPFKPPAIMMLTPSGRFATGTRLCLSMSDFHPESWNPMWTVSSILTGLLSFMLEDQITTGSLQTTDEEKQQLASTSLDYNLNHVQLRAMFQKELEAAKSGSKSDTQPAPTQSSAEHEFAEAASTSVTQNSDAQTTSSTKHNDKDDDDDAAATAEPNADDDAAKAEHHDNDAAAAASELDNMRINSAAQAQSQHAVPASVQSAAVDMLQKQLKGGQPEQALLQIEAALKHHQNQDDFQSQLLLLKAQAVAMIGDLPAAIEVMQQWQGASTQSTAGLADSKAGSPETWQELWQEASHAKDEGNALFRKGDLSGALEKYDMSQQKAPQCAAVHCNKAATLAKLERHSEAAVAAQQALAINKNYAKARRRLNDSNEAIRRK